MRIRGSFLLLSTVLAAASPAQDDNNNDDANKKVIPVYSREPGKGPQLQFDELRWEFWWFFNREPLIGLRDSLNAQQAGQAAVDEPFQRIGQEARASQLVPNLVFALRDPNPKVRAAAVLALGKTQEPAARPALAGALDDKEFPVRLDAILALGVWNNSIFLGHLEEILLDEEQELQARFHAAIALGLIGGAQTAESFRQLLAPAAFKTLPVQVQAALAYAAGVARDPESITLVRSLLDDKATVDTFVRCYLTLALGKAGTDADLPRLHVLLKDADAQVRRSAAIALGVRLRGGGAKGPGVDAVKALTTAARDDGDAMTSNFSYISLGWLGGAEALKVLRDDFARVHYTRRSFIALALGLIADPDSVPLLVKELEQEADTSMKGAIAIAIGLHRDIRAAPALRKAFEMAGEPVLKGHIGLALGMVKDTESGKILMDEFFKGNDIELLPNLAIALGLLGIRPAVTDMLARATKETNEFVKQSMLFAVGLVGDQSALAPLCDLIKHERDVAYVRSYSAAALGHLGEERSTRAIAMLSIDSNYTARQAFLEELFAEL